MMNDSLVKTLSHLLPLSHLLDSLRAALAGDIAGVLAPTLILFAFTVVALAVLTFHWDPDAPLLRCKLRVGAAQVI